MFFRGCPIGIKSSCDDGRFHFNDLHPLQPQKLETTNITNDGRKLWWSTDIVSALRWFLPESIWVDRPPKKRGRNVGPHHSTPHDLCHTWNPSPFLHMFANFCPWRHWSCWMLDASLAIPMACTKTWILRSWTCNIFGTSQQANFLAGSGKTVLRLSWKVLDWFVTFVTKVGTTYSEATPICWHWAIGLNLTIETSVCQAPVGPSTPGPCYSNRTNLKTTSRGPAVEPLNVGTQLCQKQNQGSVFQTAKAQRTLRCDLGSTAHMSLLVGMDIVQRGCRECLKWVAPLPSTESSVD